MWAWWEVLGLASACVYLSYRWGRRRGEAYGHEVGWIRGWQARAETLRTTGPAKPHFWCKACVTQAVVDSDGCCVVCGGDTEVVTPYPPPFPANRTHTGH